MVPLAYLRPNSLNALTLGAICVRQSAYRSNDEPLPLHPRRKEIRILSADDHPIVCERLNAVFALEDDLKVVVHAHDGEKVCVHYKQLCPDILILDLRMPKMDGI